MQFPNKVERQNFIVQHPIIAGYLWALVTILLMFAIDATTGHRSDIISLRKLPSALIVFLIVGPAWGYVTRWYFLRNQKNAR